MGYLLQGRQERFCQEYVSDIKRNQTQSAIRAGYSVKAARVEASRMMRNDNIRARIKELERETLEEAGYSADALRPVIMRQLVSQATVDAGDIAQVVYGDDARRPDALEQLADADGGQRLLDFGDALVYIKPTSEWSPEERAAVKAVRQTRTKEGVSVEVQMYDKTAALKLLAEITGLTKQPIGLSVGDPGAPVSMNIVFGEAASGYEANGNGYEANGYEASTTLESGS